MSRFWAKVVDGNVVDMIVADEEHIQSGVAGDPSLWIETPRDGKGPTHRIHEAGVGFTYDAEADVFVPGQPFPSWTLDKSTYTWRPPVEPPAHVGCHRWDEENLVWIDGGDQTMAGCSE